MTAISSQQSALSFDGFAIGESIAFTLNRAQGASEFSLPADGWYQIAKYGSIRKELERPGKKPVEIVQDFDREAAKLMVANFRAEAGKPNFGGLLVDFDHFSFDKTKSSRAAGWIDDVADRDDGMWAKMRTSGSGEAALKSGDYRGFSPVFGFPPRDYRPGERAKPVALLAGALTNQPTFRGMVPLSNRQGDLAQTQTSTGDDMDYKAMLLTLLGLPATATDAEIEAAKGKVGDNATKAAQYDATKNRLDKLEAEQIDRDLDKYKLTGAAREKWKGALTQNRDNALALLESLGTDGSGYARTHNRDAAGAPRQSADQGEDDKASPAEEARAARVDNRAREISRKEGIPYAIAFNRADAEEAPVTK